MDLGFAYNFPALRGVQAGREYYVAMCPLRLIPKIFLFDEEEIPAAFRSQRVINRARIPEICEYIVSNASDYVFSSLTASIDGDIKYIPIDNTAAGQNIGQLSISMDSKFLINDGQHRRAAIEEALKVNPELGNETISVVFFKDQGLKKSQQMFADLNRHAVNTTRSIGILYDSRDELAILTKECVDRTSLLQSLTDKENASLSLLSPKLFTLSNIHNTNIQLLDKQRGTEITSLDREYCLSFWDNLCKCFDEWQRVYLKQLSASQVRKNYVNSYGIVLEALGLIGHQLRDHNPQDQQSFFKALNSLNWSRENETDWLERVFNYSGRINKNNTCIRLTANRIKVLVGLRLSDEELQLEQAFKTRKKEH